MPGRGSRRTCAPARKATAAATISSALARGCASMNPTGGRAPGARHPACAGTRALCHLAQVAAQQRGAPDGRERPVERGRQCILHLRLLEADAQLTTEELGEVPRLVRAERCEHLAYDLAASRRAGGSRQLGKASLDPGEGMTRGRPCGDSRRQPCLPRRRDDRTPRRATRQTALSPRPARSTEWSRPPAWSAHRVAGRPDLKRSAPRSQARHRAATAGTRRAPRASEVASWCFAPHPRRKSIYRTRRPLRAVPS